MSLASIGLTQEIIDSYLASAETPLSTQQAIAVSNAFRELQRYEEAFTVAWTTGVADPMLRLVAPALHKHDSIAARRALHYGLILLVRQNQWDLLTRFASSLEFIPAPEWREKELRAFVHAEVDSDSEAAEGNRRVPSMFRNSYLLCSCGLCAKTSQARTLEMLAVPSRTSQSIADGSVNSRPSKYVRTAVALPGGSMTTDVAETGKKQYRAVRGFRKQDQSSSVE